MEKQKRHLGIQTVSKKDIDRNTDEEIDTENALRDIQSEKSIGTKTKIPNIIRKRLNENVLSISSGLAFTF